MKINGFFLFLGIFLLTVVLASIYSPFRYLKYFLPLIPIIVFALREKKLTVEKKVINYYFTFLAFYLIVIGYLLLQNIFFQNLSARFFPNTIFILSPLLFIIFTIPYFNVEKIPQYVKAIFFINIGVFLFEEGSDLLNVVTNLNAIKEAILTSELTTENNLAYVFGFIVLYFLIEKYNKWYLIFSIIFFILCFKRIAIAAVVVSGAIYFIISFLKIDISDHRKKLALVGILVNLFYIQLTYLIVSGTFDQFIFEKTGFNADRFLMGRKTLYTQAFEEAGAYNLTGIGLGKIDDAMFNFYGIAINLHSEVLKNYFEFGIVLFILWMFIFFYKNLFSNKAAVILLYFNVLILTDNVFIYFEVMFYFYFLVLIFLSQTPKQLTELSNEHVSNN